MSTPKMKRQADGSRHRDRRHQEALERNRLPMWERALLDATAPVGQLAKLDDRLGTDRGAAKERARLMAMLTPAQLADRKV